MKPKQIPPLYNHQVRDVQFCLDNPRVMDLSDPGCGKTRVQIEAFAIRLKKGGGKALVIAPKSLLRSAWENDFHKFAPQVVVSVCPANKREEGFARTADVYVTNIDAAIWLAKQKPAFFKGFDTLIIDECFPAGTPVDTPTGPVNIEVLKEGDLVYTSSGALPITRVFVKPAIRLVRVTLDDGTNIDCTPDHPFATTQGWREARFLYGMHVVRTDIREHAQPRATVLQQDMLKKSYALKSDVRRESAVYKKGCGEVEGETKLEQGDTLSRGNQKEDKRNSQSQRAGLFSTWGQRALNTLRTFGRRNVTEDVGASTNNQDGAKTRQWLPTWVQSGFRKPETEASYRSGWEFARVAKTLGCEERRIAGVSRVESVSNIQPIGYTDVYNLQVDGPHDYSVRGTLVHNCTAFKHFTSKRSRAAAKIVKYFERRYGMTGTPNSNTIADIWHPFYLIDDGKRLGRSFYHFRSSVCTPKQVGPQPNMVKWEEKDGAEAAVGGLIKDMVVRNVFEECHDIPANTMNSVPFFMTPKQSKAYQQMEKSAITLLNNKEIVSAVNAAVVAGKLLQIASGAVYGDDLDGDYASIDTERYELVCDLIEERTNPCVVFFNWKHQKAGLIAEFEKRGITFTVIDGTVSDNNRNTSVQHFQAGFYHVLLAHPASAAHGLTLTKATTTIWASPTYNLEYFTQGNRRIYRAGQTQKTETICILAKGTIEDHVFSILTKKGIRQLDMLSILKELSE